MADSGPHLVATAEGLALTSPALAAAGARPLLVDYTSSPLLRRLRQGWRQELVLRAAGVKSGVRPAVADLTAGQGIDALLLANAGCEVWLSESNPLIHALLEDALARAARQPGLAPAAHRMHLLPAGDSGQRLAHLARHATVACVDTMFDGVPRGANRKALRLLAETAGVASQRSAERLLEQARGEFQRVVVKRRRRAAPLAADPHHSHRGRTIRFDVYLNPAVPKTAD